MNKSERAKIAVDRTKFMGEEYPESIVRATQESEVIRNNTQFVLEPLTTTEAIYKYENEYPCVLNFASYKYPGGGFIKGSMAQEEALCHDSNLYNILLNFEDEYKKNREDLNYGLYRNWGIYTPSVLFSTEEGGFAYSDVFTCPAPNVNAYRNSGKFNWQTYMNALESRIRFVVANMNRGHLPIIGAFGCGVFGNHSYVVAKLFKHYFTEAGVPKVIIAIPDENSNNFKEFERIYAQ